MPAFAAQEVAGSGLYGGGRQDATIKDKSYGPMTPPCPPPPAATPRGSLAATVGVLQGPTSLFLLDHKDSPHMPASSIWVSPGPWEGAAELTQGGL